MQVERRRIVRREVQLPARIEVREGAALRDCTVIDITDLGARVEIDHPENVPDEFTIHLSPSGFPRRRCRLVWRQDHYIGVVFDADWRHRADDGTAGKAAQPRVKFTAA